MSQMPDHPEKNPWTTLKSEEVYESPWIKVTRHDILHPGGSPGTYSVVHFRNLAIGVLPLDENYNTWLVGQYRYPIEQYSWEIPEGGGNRSVEPVESAKRELLEETGISASKWTPIQEMYLSNSATDEFCVLFIAQGLSFGDAQPEESEELRTWKIPFDDLYRLVCEGKITDSLTVTAVLKAKLMMLEGKL